MIDQLLNAVDGGYFLAVGILPVVVVVVAIPFILLRRHPKASPPCVEGVCVGPVNVGMAQIIIPDEATSQTYTVGGSQTAFPFTFAVFAKSDLHFSVNGVELMQTDFTLSGTLLLGGGYQGGTVNLNVAVAGVTCVLWRETDQARAANFTPATSVTVRDIDTAFNRLTAIAQDQRRDLGRAALTAPGTTPSSLAGNFVKLDTNGFLVGDGGATAAALAAAAASAAASATSASSATSAANSSATSAATAATSATASATAATNSANSAAAAAASSANSANAATAAANSAAIASSTPAAITATAAAAAASASASAAATAAALAAASAGAAAGNFRNRIINGDMRIDQRRAGATVVPGTGVTYLTDRWAITSSQAARTTIGQANVSGITLPQPPESPKCLSVTCNAHVTVASTDCFAITQTIEGINFADLMWGTPYAQPITLSFYAYAPGVTTSGGSVKNASGRSYPFTFTTNDLFDSFSNQIWKRNSITIPGDTSGTWPTDNTGSLTVSFGLACGSNFVGTAGAWANGSLFSAVVGSASLASTGFAFAVTEVQVEPGSATPFERRPLATELQLCQRYYETSFPQGTAPANNITNNRAVGAATGTTQVIAEIQYAVEKRGSPAVSLYGAVGSGANWIVLGGAPTTAIAAGIASTKEVEVVLTGTYASAGAYICEGGWAADAEL